ncbi:hypothetical protein RUND412_000772 [Rhizina undulata]
MAEKAIFEHVQSTAGANCDSEAGLDLVYEQALIKKIDWKLLPILGALYSVALIDRTNMADAAVAGMIADLKLSVGSRYSIILFVFFIPYILFELPSNIILRQVGAAAWLATIGLFWGAVMIGMGFVRDWRWLAVCRIILGFCEAGKLNQIRVTMRIRAGRIAAFYMVSVFVGAFSSILAYGLMQMDELGGILTCIVALAAYYLILDFPDKLLSKSRGKFLAESDIELIKARIDRDRHDSQADPLTWAKVRKHLSDWKLWV